MLEFVQNIETAVDLSELKNALTQIASLLADDIDSEIAARNAKIASRGLALASGKIGAAAKSYFRGY